jgi:hypothetical protein
METRMVEHHQHIRLYTLENLAVAEQSTDLGYGTLFSYTSILDKKIGRVIQIELHLDHMNSKVLETRRTAGRSCLGGSD